MVTVLAVADEVDDALVADLWPARTAEVILACGDLPFDYLRYLMDGLDRPLVFVPGNHDPDLSGYRQSRAGLMLRAGLPEEPPWPPGAVNADGRVVEVAGLRIAGLGGCLRYRDGPNQYTEPQQARRARQLARRVRRHRGRLDVLLTHAPPRDCGDAEDLPHRGFAATGRLVERLRPRFLLHGHIHPHGADQPDRTLGATRVCNVVGRHLLDLDPSRRVYTDEHASPDRDADG